MFNFEKRHEPLLPRKEFINRMVKFGGGALLMVGVSWIVGILGYKVLEGMSWIDSILNAAMILGGMGPVNELHTTAGKLFASVYAIFSGVVFLVSIGVLLAPIIHRLMHQFHIKEDKS